MAQSDGRDELEKLEQLCQDKAHQERSLAFEKRELEAVPKEFRSMAASREVKAFGWGDNGSKWQAAPPKLQRMIETYNSTPKAARPLVLDSFTDVAAHRKKLRELLDKQQSNYRKNYRGMSL